MDDQQRIERYRLGLANAIARLANSGGRPDWIAYNERQIAKYERLLSEPLRPLPPPIPH